MKTRKNILMVLGLVLLLGVSYAFYTYQKYSGMQNLLNGEIYLNYLENNEVHVSGIFPETKEEALKRDDNTISFKVLSKNTSDKDIYYGITLNYGEEISNKVRIDAKYIMIYLECDGKVLIDGIRYSDFNNRRIYVDKIDAKTYTETTKNYTLRFWVDEETTISDADSNASYKATEWANSYLNFKVNIDAGLETMNMPLSMETSDTYVENNKAYFIAKISNFINIEDLGKDSNDTMNLKVSGTNSDIKFSYKDGEGNTVEEKSDMLDLTYLFTKNKTVEIQVFVHPNNDANGKTNVLLEIYKNKELMQSFIKRVEVKGNNYCLNNGFNKLVDCMLVSDSLSESVDVAKTNIANKGEPNLNDTAPSYRYIEKVSTNVSNVLKVSATYFGFGKQYTFDEKTGMYSITDYKRDEISDNYLGYYTCGELSVGYTCQKLYKIISLKIENNITNITLADVYSSTLTDTIRSEIGLYKNVDNYGDVYYYRGDVQNNNVYFGGYYWKIIRTNGDGSIRLIYAGASADARGNASSINQKLYKYNDRSSDLSYVGYMYGDNFEVKSYENSSISFSRNTSKYYWADAYTYNEQDHKFYLSGNIMEATYLEMMDANKINMYTCKITTNDGCELLIKVTDYKTKYAALCETIGYFSKDVDSMYLDTISSNAKKEIDLWYENNILNNLDDNNHQLTNYIVDNTFCNERSITTTGEIALNKTINFRGVLTLNNPSFKCENDTEKFSVTSLYGNAHLKYPIALITASELIYAGGKNKITNKNFYLNSNVSYWTMTPFNYYYSEGMVGNSLLGYGQVVQYGMLYYANALRPVINIRSDVLISRGDGTVSSPYHLKLQ